jgi:hypothetical protein
MGVEAKVASKEKHLMENKWRNQEEPQRRLNPMKGEREGRKTK